mmetsp:Transcript_118561/g.206429  ORF Transcript_118561/g.206429 Transcript_118561/m.206429 type:complete len:202 (-) Transcript_118561:4418-5023(-)
MRVGRGLLAIFSSKDCPTSPPSSGTKLSCTLALPPPGRTPESGKHLNSRTWSFFFSSLSETDHSQGRGLGLKNCTSMIRVCPTCTTPKSSLSWEICRFGMTTSARISRITNGPVFRSTGISMRKLPTPILPPLVSRVTSTATWPELGNPGILRKRSWEKVTPEFARIRLSIWKVRGAWLSLLKRNVFLRVSPFTMGPKSRT